MAVKGHYSRERDAARHARDHGLKDGEFEIVKGPKGFTWRETKKHSIVPDAKFHGPEDGIVRHLDPPVVGEQTPDGVMIDRVPEAGQHVVVPIPAEETKPRPGYVFTGAEAQQIRNGAEASAADAERRQNTNERGEEVKLVCDGCGETHLGPEIGINPGDIHKATAGAFTDCGGIFRLVALETLPGKLRESRVPNPTKLVWSIADEMITENPAVRRRDVMAACVARGIAFHTARTQYQQWFTARRESQQHSAEVQAAQASKNHLS